MSYVFCADTESWVEPSYNPQLESLDDPRVWDKVNKQFEEDEKSQELQELDALMMEAFGGLVK